MPGVPTEDEITADLNKMPSTSSLSSFGFPALAGPPPAPASSPVQLTLRDKWEDIRDTVTETNAFKTLSKHASNISKVRSVIWTRVQRVAWVVGTSALILVVPLLYEVDRELTIEPPAANTSTPTPAAPTSTDASTSAASSTTTTVDAPATTTPAAHAAPASNTASASS